VFENRVLREIFGFKRGEVIRGCTMRTSIAFTLHHTLLLLSLSSSFLVTGFLSSLVLLLLSHW
jgi:hypothetical protein